MESRTKARMESRAEHRGPADDRRGSRLRAAVVFRFAICSLALVAALGDGDASAGAAANPWASDTFSPRPGLVDDTRDAPLAALCKGGIDGALVTVAGELASSLATRAELPDAAEIEWRMRKAGSPHVWPRSWGAHGAVGSLDRKTLVADVASWLGASPSRIRCGVASRRVGDQEALAIVAVEPFAELAALPTRAKVGAFLELDATLLRGGTTGRVVLLPPSGAPRTLLSHVRTPSGVGFAHLLAQVPVVSSGRHVVQVLADDANGPRPVLEAEVWAGVEPPITAPTIDVPGEARGDGVSDEAAALFSRLNGARAAGSLPPLARDAVLDRVASAHALAMRKAHLLGHDVGDGDPAARAAAAGASYKVIGENVAKARGERAAHRALYASPSHRGNMLETRFRKVGIGVTTDPATGETWVAQLYGG